LDFHGNGYAPDLALKNQGNGNSQIAHQQGLNLSEMKIWNKVNALLCKPGALI